MKYMPKACCRGHNQRMAALISKVLLQQKRLFIEYSIDSIDGTDGRRTIGRTCTSSPLKSSFQAEMISSSPGRRQLKSLMILHICNPDQGMTHIGKYMLLFN